MFEEKEDRVFLDVFRANAGPRVVTREVDANLEDEAFAEAVVEACIEIFPRAAARAVFSSLQRVIDIRTEFLSDPSSHPKGGPHVCKKPDVAGSSIYIQ